MLLAMLSFIPSCNFVLCHLMATEWGWREEEAGKENQCQISKQNLKTNLSKLRRIRLGGSFP